MENWGLIVYREDVFLFDEEKGSYLDKIYSALVISHEIAHNVSESLKVYGRPLTSITSYGACVLYLG